MTGDLDPRSADPLRQLIDSTVAFYARFGVQPELQNSLSVFNEEVYELIQAALDGNDERHIAEEMADVFVTAIGVCLARGIPAEQMIAQVQAVAAKNDAKTHETHEYRDGKIRRRVNVQR